MQFQRIGTAALIMMLLSISPLSRAADDDLPPPADPSQPAAPQMETAPETPSAPSANLSDEMAPTPAPTLGEEALPEPTTGDSSKAPTTKSAQDDNVFLPSPAGNDSIDYAPVAQPVNRSYGNDLDWRTSMSNRPMFSLYAGPSFKAYPTAYVQTTRATGIGVGASVRVLSLGQTIFAHVFGSYAWYSVGSVGRTTDPRAVSNVHDETLEVGPLLEIGLGRRISIFGSVLRRQSRITADTQGVINSDNQNLDYLKNVGEEPTWKPGIGAQWDFYVIPHGSLGLNVRMEENLFSLLMTFSMEPAPRKKLSLRDYDEME